MLDNKLSICYTYSVQYALRNIVEFLTKLQTNNYMNGTIKKLIADRGFGFISREGEAKDLFFHSKEVKGVTFEELKEGDAVTFDIVEGEKPSATNVSRA